MYQFLRCVGYHYSSQICRCIFFSLILPFIFYTFAYLFPTSFEYRFTLSVLLLFTQSTYQLNIFTDPHGTYSLLRIYGMLSVSIWIPNSLFIGYNASAYLNLVFIDICSQNKKKSTTHVSEMYKANHTRLSSLAKNIWDEAHAAT